MSLIAAIAILAYRWTSDPRRELIAAARMLEFRPIEGRLAEDFDQRPSRSLRAGSAELAGFQRKASELRAQWKLARSVGTERLAAVSLLMSGRDEESFATLGDLIRRDANGSSLETAVWQSSDPDLLIDFSAAGLQRADDARRLVLSYEAADHAWQLRHDVSAAWNRALSADRIGMPASASRAWGDVLARETSPEWKREAKERMRAAIARTQARPDQSLEVFFYRRLIEDLIAGRRIQDIARGDQLATDSAAALADLRSPSDHRRAIGALHTYLRGRDSFERNDYDDAAKSYVAAESELQALHLPLVLLARDQRIRSECSQAMPGCLASMRAFRKEIAESGRYAWLAARGTYGEGQVLYRQGRVYEAADHFQRALTAFERLGDATSAGFMHVLLANAFAAGGETDLALGHFLAGARCRTPGILDRRRKMLEDAIAFMLRHGYLGTAELLLEDLAWSSTTPASNVTEATLRGVVAFRRGDRLAASIHFSTADRLVKIVKDESSRRDVQFRLAIAEAGSQTRASQPILSELDAAIASHERQEFSIWLPQLLTERGAAWERQNDVARAERDYRRAIAILESREPRIDETVLALGIVAPSQSPFDRAVALLLRQGRIAGALSIAQRESALRISSLHARGEGVRDVFEESRALGDGTIDLQRQLEPDQVAIAQDLLGTEVVTWVVRRGSISAIRQPVVRQTLLRSADRLAECRARGCDDRAAIEELSRALLRPWIEKIPRDSTLLLQPAPELEAVAFSRLTTLDGTRLVKRNALATAPSFQAFARAWHDDASRGRNDSLAFFAAAPTPGGTLAALPLSVREVTVASHFYTNALVDPHATRAQFLARAASSGVIHFAGHVVVNAARPLLSALVFEEGARLYVHELEERSFAKARLIVLSGCESGRSPQPTMSIANALLSQRVPSVVYTLWPVSDEVAEVFGIAFHRAITTGKTRAEAVREAQMAVMGNVPNEPIAWAAFAVAGTPGPLNERASREKGEP